MFSQSNYEGETFNTVVTFDTQDFIIGPILNCDLSVHSVGALNTLFEEKLEGGFAKTSSLVFSPCFVSFYVFPQSSLHKGNIITMITFKALQRPLALNW